MKTSTLRHAVSIALLVAATGTAEPTRAQKAVTDTSPPPRAAVTGSPIDGDIDLPAGTLAASLDALGQQSGLRMDYAPTLVSGKQVGAVHGHMSWRDALGRLLQGSGLAYRQAADTSVVIVRVPDSAASTKRSTANDAAATTSTAAPAAAQLATVTVTGTRIRGGSTPSPVVSIGSEQIQQEGFADLGEVIRSVPQNFSGGQNPGVAAGATGGGQGNQNITGGSGLNLRGLGPDATLTLLDGRRMSYGGFTQMVDISAIPVEAVDRIEIVADGASAIYGSDAVGGVGNVILRRDFDGVTVGSRYGSATDGGLTTHEYTATGGTHWSTGGFIATWQKTDNDPIYSDQRSYTQGMYAPSTLYQASDLRSGLFSLHQSLGDIGEFRLDTFRTEREIATDEGYATNYEHNAPSTTTSLISPSLDLFLPGDWTLSVDGTWGRESTDVNYSVVTPASETSTLSRTGYRNRSRDYEIGAEGPLFSLNGQEARLAVGAGYRDNAFQSRNLVSGVAQVDGSVSSRFAYAELNVPLIGPEQGVPGVQRLALTGALRGEDYDSFGSVTTPKLGVVYSPSADFTLKGSWGKSFKVPTLSQQYLERDAFLFPAAALGGTGYAPNASVLYLTGGNPDLRPEKARTWSASLAFHPEVLPGLETELTWFDVDYADRVVQPLVPAQALSNPAFAQFIVDAPSAAELAQILQTFRFTNATGAAYNPANVVAIAPNLFMNTSRQQAKGLDASGSYRFDLAPGRLTLRGSASWLHSTQQISSAQPAYDLAGTLFYPARLNSQLGAVWQQGGFTASLFGNYKSGVTDTVDGHQGASFTTFDATLRYDTGARDDAWSGVALELSVQNALDRAPPLYAVTSRTYAPYDSTNYSAIGRYLSLSVSKHW
ncbi:outer membrane receptor protein involved in Fe transport [Rhodanobacter sp. K2T2]|uniref:TonB-dependent receptor n=1 Tax=Rhodanobacter sp. K2T2 TaxID=2723085 RepID=UPI0015CCA3CB|nr:TonB-dependent receptor [Rhodanobacter sp. K2T2]NYE30387.1 outer membrane receptor protein involved in Fe transport [Rhodanobacter sp. K2T2]